MASTSISKAEKSYIQAGFLSSPPLRADGRALHDFRSVALETGVAPLANGSARLSIGANAHDGGGGTEVLAATKLEVENVEEDGCDGGRIVCTVTCSPAAYPQLSSNALDDLQYDMTVILHQTLSHPSLHPNNLGILPKKKSWLLNLDIVVLADAGNIYDAIFMAARAALWDTKVPKTRSVEYKVRKGNSGGVVGGKTGSSGDMDVDEETTSGFDTRQIQQATDFELTDYWDEGEVLDGRERWPISITLNLPPPTHFLDATLPEESAVPLKALLVYSFPPSESPNVQAMRILGSGELTVVLLKDLVKEGEKYARELFIALNSKLKEEDIRRNQKARERFARR
ncbi:ribosomal protein S5 domain 2-type protein [Crucibulum laeve]|uniref:Ribosomal RNA-processing protein 42 n=1 Tax=Crucibulum laeve TaxID=68775 RepID=A0A5C3LSP9_9AGAR|nr:ribosomal protein S5 domain 2-type protein [Crucibulum laeve]